MEGWNTLLDALKWLGAIFVGLLTWVYSQDRKEVKAQFASHASRADAQGQRISTIEESRPKRDELTNAVDGLREELRSDMLAIRSDMTAHSRDVTQRLDTLIARVSK